MTVTFDLPPDIEACVSQLGPDVSATVKQAALVDLYRREVIGHADLARALGLSRLEADGLLKAHEVYLDDTIESLEADAEALKRLVQL
ncbi:MAG: UPF0175 family protein [Phycisphaerales bacterium]